MENGVKAIWFVVILPHERTLQRIERHFAASK
jgi:hypothetical protein